MTRYANFMQDTQDLESSVCNLAPTWGHYRKLDLEGLRQTLYKLDRIKLEIEQLTKKVEQDIANEINGDKFESGISRQLFDAIPDLTR